jgi:N6-L-threonylcarbamoyladenine synthase
MSTYILGIETSCDETSVAIYDGQNILSHVTHSQIDKHKSFGGVLPELASRLHLELITLVIDKALNDAKLTMEAISAFAVTRGPGLIGALHIGLLAAKTLSFIYNKPLIPVHHLAAHLEAGHFVKPLQYPYLSLLVSGGHTELIEVSGVQSYKIIGQTRDDAVGESYDKVARMLSLPYPGGPRLDVLAQGGKPIYPLPTPLRYEGYDFSYSGLKTHTFHLIERLKKQQDFYRVEDIAASFQKVAIEILFEKAIKAFKEKPYHHLVIGGGVSANSYLRALAIDYKQRYNIDIIIPPLWACTDNGAMIALLGYKLFKQGIFGERNIGPDPQWSIENLG